MRRHPSDRLRSVLGEPSEIRLIAPELGSSEHILDKTRLDAIRRRHTHIGWRPSRIAASVRFSSLVYESNSDWLFNPVLLLRSCQRSGQSGCALTDNDDVTRWEVHRIDYGS